MTRDQRKRLNILKAYLEGWDWNLEPWFVLNEEDGKVLARVIGQHEALLVSRAAARERKREEGKRLPEEGK